MDNRAQLATDSLAIITDLRHHLENWEAHLRSASNPHVPEDARKGASFQARRVARIVASTGVMHDLSMAVCWTERLNEADNADSDLIAAIDAAFGVTEKVAET